MRLDDQQRDIRCPSHKTKHNTDAQKESVVSVIIGQSFQCKMNQLLTKGDLWRKRNITCHVKKIRNLNFKGRKLLKLK